jgi:hypothetical protein
VSKSKREQTDERLSSLLEYFGERVSRVFDCHFCLMIFEDDEAMRESPAQNPRTWALQGIQNACVDSTLLALRDLDDFLTPGRGKPDDLKASHFGFRKDCHFLTKTERESINKLIAHSTLAGAQRQASGWDVLELVSKGVSQSLEFLKWIIVTYIGHFNLWTAAIQTQRTLESRLNYITTEMEKRRRIQAEYQ